MTESESIMRKQIQELEKDTKTINAKLHTATVQLTQKEAELERSLGKISDLQTQVALLNADVDNNKVHMYIYKGGGMAYTFTCTCITREKKKREMW